MKGGHKLSELIYRESDDNNTLCDLLSQMIDLIVDRDGTPNQLLIHSLKQ